MIDEGMIPEGNETTVSRADALYALHKQRICSQTDRLFAGLLLFQWVGAIVLALVYSPRTWSGAASTLHPHVWAAIFTGAALAIPPSLMVWNAPGAALNRHVIAVAQMLLCSLLIQITGGRVETHFHIFGSLAFLSFYRDWRVLATASAVTGLDHIVRAIYLPLSLYGRVLSNPWQSAEHVAWVVFNDIFLVWSCLRGKSEMITIALREANNAHFLHQAQHDPLTGLPNRLLFSKMIESGIADTRKSGRKLALFCLDLNRFKQINDSLGHHVGDCLLQGVGRRLSAYLGTEGTLVRMGGDEFAVILSSIGSAEEAGRVANGILESFNSPFVIAGDELCVGVSVGVCLFPDSASDATELQKNADVAMYRAKSRKKNGAEIFSEATAAPVVERMGLEYQLRQAVVRNEFTVFYRPRVTLDGNLIGFEALVRWDHPTLGRTLPSIFIPMAEDTGLIRPIGELFTRQAQAADWQDRLLELQSTESVLAPEPVLAVAG